MELPSSSSARLLDRQSRRVTFALEGNIYATETAVEWYGQVAWPTNPATELKRWPPRLGSSDGVYLVPAFVGLGAPHWQSSAPAPSPAWRAAVVQRTWRAPRWNRLPIRSAMSLT
ncbi:MAG: hypothetical protein R2867_14420 [Caldilineaceae bacterium]